MHRHPSFQRSLTIASSTLLTLTTSLGSQAQQESTGTARPPVQLEEVLVTSSRLPGNLTTYAGSVTVLGKQQLLDQTRLTTDLGEILGSSIPGMAVSKGNEMSNYGQTMRGRKPAVLIDGSPQTIPLREAARDLRIISPAAIEQIEVIRGATALYGMGGAGGVINYITRRPTAADGWEFQTDASFGSSLTETSSDSFDYKLEQFVSGKTETFDLMASVSHEQSGLSFDADGDMIAPDAQGGDGGTSDMETNSLFAKLGYDISATQRLEASFSYYRAEQDTDYGLDRSNTEGGYSHAATKEELGKAFFFDEGYAIDVSTDNDFAALSYSHEELLLGTSMRVTATYQDYAAVFGFNPFAAWGLYPRANNPFGGGQTELLSTKHGLRFEFDTPLRFLPGRILWGLDYLRDTTSQGIWGTDWYYVPEVEQEDISLFAQFELGLTDRLNIQGGVRYVNFVADVDDYTRLAFNVGGEVIDGEVVGGFTVGGNDIQGAELDYEMVLPNLGASYDLTDNWNLFVAYSEGFIISDLGRVLRSWDRPSIDVLENEAQVVKGYEAGLRGTYQSVDFELAAYRSKSRFGTTLELIPGTDIFQIARAPERIWGAELSVDWTINERSSLMASYSWVDGEFDRNNDGDYEQMTTDRIPPEKLVTQYRHSIGGGWDLFLQGLYSFEHKPFGDELLGFGRNPIKDFFVLDASITGKVGPGYLSLNLSNVLNEDYATPYSQTNKSLPYFHYKAPGRGMSLQYSWRY